MVQSVQRKHSVAFIASLCIGVLFAACILFVLGSEYYRLEINEDTTVKPQARQIVDYIDQAHGSILHEYNRTAGDLIDGPGSPSYEYYVEFPDVNLKRYAIGFSSYLSRLGYQVKYSQYSAANECTRYDFDSSNVLPDGRIATNASRLQYCKDATGVDDPLLFGATDNDGAPYFTVYGRRDGISVFAQISDKTFKITSNDFWSDEYVKKFHVADETVRRSHSVMTVIFDKISP